MGEVYRARDTRLDRLVAIKVLPASDSCDPLARERIASEARAIAALSHPNICTVHDVGSQEGVNYFVMELVNGETLATRLSRGALPLTEAIRYACQIAAALVEAHRTGIVHRDLKPANIMLQPAAGAPMQAKLLDFGVAKANVNGFQSKPVNSPLSAIATDLTIAGFVVGTAHYMAPEQIDRLCVDSRTDIFAFGAVLFEMLTARKAFGGANREEALTAVRSDGVPAPSTFRARVPAALDRLVLRCLAKHPEDRYQNANDLLGDLCAIQRGLDTSRRAIAVAAVAALAATGGLLAYELSVRNTAADPPLTPSLTRLPASAGVFGAPALSPDGSRLVFSWVGEGLDNPELMLLPLGSTAKTRLTHDRGVEEWPVWSPDGKEIAFIRCAPSSCGIFALRVDDGSERRLRELRSDRYNALAWSPDGRSLVYGERPSTFEPYALFELSVQDSSIHRLTAPVSGEIGDLRFAFSADGKALAFIRLEPGGPGVYVLSRATGTVKPVLLRQQEWFGGVAWSADARHLIVSANQRGIRRLWRLRLDGGGLESLDIVGEDAYYPSVLGTRLLFVRSFNDWDLSWLPMSGEKLQAPVSFASSTRPDLDPAFSPDGRRLAFVSERSGSRELWVSDADGAGASQLTSLRGPLVGRPSWSPDGRSIAFHGRGIQVMSLDGGSLRQLSEDGERPAWSADGAWIYFVRSRGRFSVWKVPAIGGTAVEVPAKGACAVREAPGTGDLYFLRQDGIWRQSRGNAQEAKLIVDSTFTLPGYWAVEDRGIYYIRRTPGPNSTWVHHLVFYDFTRAHVTDLGALPGKIDDWVGGFTVSPDRQTVVYSQGNYESSEIMLVEQFR
jgi:Tol biopolymer transport system component/tRNA A-37 threonylcarbamoyl transferase component Bud32